MIEPQVGKVKNDHTTSGFTVIIHKKKSKIALFWLVDGST